MKNKALLSCLSLLFATTLAFPSVCFAGSYASGTTGSGQVPVRLHADREHAYLILSSRKGIAYVEQHSLGVISTGLGEEAHHGFYEVGLFGEDIGFITKCIWAPSATFNTRDVILDTDLVVELPYKGNYVLYVTPLSNDEAAHYWVSDRIYMWKNPASWDMTTMVNCSVGFQSVSGLVNVRIYIDGQITDQYLETITYDGQPISVPSYSGYTCVNPDQTIRLSSTGDCSPESISLYYQKDSSGSTRKPTRTSTPVPQPAGLGGAYDMGVPRIGSRIYRSDDMNMTIFWVQTQLKATGRWYQGNSWDCTGNLGDHTISEIKSFMKTQGYSAHSGNVDQNVINELCNYLGSRLQPVYVGGIYDYMSSIMQGGSAGSMSRINSNLIDMIPHVTTGARWVQTCLKRIGYYNGSIDGMYGEETERAVNAFQRDYGWEQRNYVTLGVARAMLEAYYQRGGRLSELP